MVRVEACGRLHFGFQNLSLAYPRLYGGVGVALEAPRITLEVRQASSLNCQDSEIRPYAEQSLDVLGVPGADVQVPGRYRRHVGLGSGTQIALACLTGIAEAYDEEIDQRSVAPTLGRGGRSGVGVATFENGGFVVDAGHPTTQFTTRLPDRGAWEVPEPIIQHPLPESWRFVLVTPDEPRGKSGLSEAENMQAVVERSEPGIADDIATLLTRRLLPAVVEGNRDEFGAAIATLGRLNGAWYADEQGGIYRPPAGTLVAALDECPFVTGAGQSSWGPTVYGLTTVEHADSTRDHARTALADADLDGTVRIVAPRNSGAVVET